MNQLANWLMSSGVLDCGLAMRVGDGATQVVRYTSSSLVPQEGRKRAVLRKWPVFIMPIIFVGLIAGLFFRPHHAEVAAAERGVSLDMESLGLAFGFGDSIPGGAWWSGTWMPREKGKDTPKLEVDPGGKSFSGRLVIYYTKSYQLALPILDARISDDKVLFSVAYHRPIGKKEDKNKPPTFYVLKREANEAATLIELSAPPRTQEGIQLLVTGSEADAERTIRMAKAERSGAGPELAVPGDKLQVRESLSEPAVDRNPFHRGGK